MSKQQHKTGDRPPKWERLRGMRLAEEATRKDSGTWGELTVGEVVHEDTGSVFIQVWKGNRRPDLVRAVTARGAGVPAADWPAVLAWKGPRDPSSFRVRVVAWNLSEGEAHKVKEALIAERRAEGLEIVNPQEI